MAEGEAKPCEECGQAFAERLEGFLTIRLRELSLDIEGEYDKLFREDPEKAPPAIEFTVFLTSLFSSHGIKEQGMLLPEAVSAKRKCLVQCALPTFDIKNSFLEFNSSDFHNHKVLALIKFLPGSPLGRFITGILKREFGLKALQK